MYGVVSFKQPAQVPASIHLKSKLPLMDVNLYLSLSYPLSYSFVNLVNFCSNRMESCLSRVGVCASRLKKQLDGVGNGTSLFSSAPLVVLHSGWNLSLNSK